MRTLIVLTAAAALAVTATAAYWQQQEAMYPAAEIAAGLCFKEQVLVYPNDSMASAKLYCVNRRPGLKLVDPRERFPLTAMTALCPLPGKPAEVAGSLTCIDPTGTCTKPGTLPRTNETGELECNDFLNDL